MPQETRPALANKTIRTFDLYYNSGSGNNNMGTIKVGSFNCPLESHDFLSNTTGKPTERMQFLEAPVIEGTVQDINWVLFAEILGLTATASGSGYIVNFTATLVDNEGSFQLDHAMSDGSTMSVYLHKANFTTGLALPFSQDTPAEVPVTITALDDTANNADSPFGYIYIR